MKFDWVLSRNWLKQNAWHHRLFNSIRGKEGGTRTASIASGNSCSLFRGGSLPWDAGTMSQVWKVTAAFNVGTIGCSLAHFSVLTESVYVDGYQLFTTTIRVVYHNFIRYTFRLWWNLIKSPPYFTNALVTINNIRLKKICSILRYFIFPLEFCRRTTLHFAVR